MKTMVRPTTIWLAVAILAVAMAGVPGGSHAASTQGKAGAGPDGKDALRPDFGQFMMAYANRFVDMYFAAEGGNWGFARYEIEKLHRIGKAGAVVRPAYSAKIKAFDGDFLQPLENAVLAQDWSKFQGRYQTAAKACNDCHAATDRGFIRFKIPFEPAEKHIDFLLESDPSGKLTK